jgi:hypothetical protein
MRAGTYSATKFGLALSGLLVLGACGGNSSSNGGGNTGVTPAASVSVSLQGAPADINIGDTLPVTAQVVGSINPAVTWTVDNILNGNADVGTITGSGNSVTYVAPVNEGTHVLAATYVQDPSKSASGQLRIHHSSISSVTVSPGTLTLNAAAQKQFAVTVAGSGNYSSTVTWSAQRGSVSSTGLYTAPSSGGSDAVTATSVQDTSKVGTTSITVVQANPVNSAISAVAVSPATLSLTANAQSQFTASVTGTGSYSSAVTWTALRGTVTSTGLYTAPATSGSDMVTLTSVQDPTKTATASVTVAPQVVAVTVGAVSPANLTRTVNMPGVVFTSSVTGSSNTAITWSVSGGTITAGQGTSSMTWTAPASASTVTITATSQADSSKSASTTVTVIPAATASLIANPSTPAYGATNVTITPVFSGATSAVVGTTQGGNDISVSPVSGAAIPIQQGGFVPSASNLYFTSYRRLVSAPGIYPQSVTSSSNTTLLSVMTAFKSSAGATLRNAAAFPTGQATGISVVAGDLIVITSARDGSSKAAVTVSDTASGGSNTYQQVGTGVIETVHYNGLFQNFAVAKATETLAISTSILGDSNDDGCIVHVISGTTGMLASVLDGQSFKGARPIPPATPTMDRPPPIRRTSSFRSGPTSPAAASSRPSWAAAVSPPRRPTGCGSQTPPTPSLTPAQPWPRPRRPSPL